MTSPTRLDKAKVALVTQHTFWASILLKRPMIFTDKVPLAAVDSRAQIYINPERIEQLTVGQIVHLLSHEVGHVMFQHAGRAGSRDHKRWNKATDAVINDILVDSNVGEIIEGGVYIPGSRDKTAEQVYDEMPEDDGEGGGGGPGGIGEDLIHDGQSMSDEEKSTLDAQIKTEIAQAAQAAKMQGKLPSSLEKLIAELLYPETPWYEILERHMVSLVKGEYSWARPNRRYEQYLPSIGKTPQMGEMVVQVDVSGSITHRELAYYNGHLARIVELVSPERVHVLYTDTRVAKHEVFECGEEVRLQFYSGGGTDMEAGFEYVDNQGISPDVFVCLTDGYTSFDPAKAPSYPVIWCISSSVKAPYGENVHFKLDA